MLKKLCAFLFVLNSMVMHAQIKRDTTDLLFTGTQISPYLQENDSTANLKISGYADTYYAYYTDSSGAGGFQKFPTISPRNNQVGINMIQLSAQYDSKNFRSTTTLFYGDCPQSSWSAHLNLIQEAHLGFRLVKKLWLDAGFFRTHLGLESIQPRENMTLSIATTTYFEPYFLSGAKLTWEQSQKWIFQVNAFNSFNQFIETNKNKVLGLSVAYNPSSKLSTSFSTLFCDEYPDGAAQKHYRTYSNFYLVYKQHKMVFAFEMNGGMQQNSQLKDSSKTAYMFSSLLAFKYRFTHQFATYLRGELYSDPDEILTGPLINSDHQLVGLDLLGLTFGFEYKPIPNSYFRIESRMLQTKSTEKIFYLNGNPTNQRFEVLLGLGIWF